MRLAIINITSGGMSLGYCKYLRNMIPRIAAHPMVEAVLCAAPTSIHVNSWFGPLPNVRFVNCKAYIPFRKNYGSELHQALEDFSPDVLFIPTERTFRFKNIPVVNMVQNMAPFVPAIDGDPLHERVKNWARKISGIRALKKARRIIAISNFVRDFLIRDLEIPKEKIGLVYHGINMAEGKEFSRPPVIPSGWEGKFLFVAGTIRPVRGLEDILPAMKRLLSNTEGVNGLVIAGAVEPSMLNYYKYLLKWTNNHNLSSKICWAQELNGKEMAWCYRNCRAFIMTSRVEAFGIIALEAMAHGCLCISANNPCLPEIFGDAASYYRPKNWKSLHDTIEMVLGWDIKQKNNAAEMAKKRAANFSWDEAAARTVAQLMKATIA